MHRPWDTRVLFPISYIQNQNHTYCTVLPLTQWENGWISCSRKTPFACRLLDKNKRNVQAFLWKSHHKVYIFDRDYIHNWNSIIFLKRHIVSAHLDFPGQFAKLLKVLSTFRVIVQNGHNQSHLKSQANIHVHNVSLCSCLWLISKQLCLEMSMWRRYFVCVQQAHTSLKYYKCLDKSLVYLHRCEKKFT